MDSEPAPSPHGAIHVPGPGGAVNIGTSLHPGDTVGGLIREARLVRGLTQAELARRAGMAQPNLSRLEHDEVSPSLSVLARVANAADYDLEVTLVTRLSTDAAKAEDIGTA